MTKKIEEILTDYTGQELPSWISYPCFTPAEKSCVFLVGNIRILIKVSEKDGLLVAESSQPHPQIISYTLLRHIEDWESVGHLVFDVLVKAGATVRAKSKGTDRAMLQRKTLLNQLDEAKALIRGTWEELE